MAYISSARSDDKGGPGAVSVNFPRKERPVSLKLRLLAAAAALLLPIQALADGPNRTEAVSGLASDGSDAVEFFAFDFTDQGSDISISRFNDNGTVFVCSADLEPSDVVQVNGQATSGSVDVTPFLGDLTCGFGTAPSSMSVECAENGNFSAHHVGSFDQTVLGERSQGHGNSSFTEANCTVEVDGITFDGLGFINRSVDKIKAN
jgi:hypothetical protein